MRKIKDFFENSEWKNNFPVQDPYIIAEAGVNHEGDMELAKRLIHEAAEAGAHAIKFQTYKAQYIAAKDSPSYWDLNSEPTTSQFELFKKYDKFWKSEFEALKLECDKSGIEFMSTPFDVESAGFLNELMDVFKISSSDITNKPFIEFLCDYKKPIILSVGASTIDEINDAVSWIRRKENKFALLHCVLNYPTPDEAAKLENIRSLKAEYPDLPIGYSDHTLPKDMKVMEVATLLGASIIEKHFTFDKTLPGNDHYHAMDKEDLKAYWNNIDRLKVLLGPGKIEVNENETPARNNARRSLIFVNDLPAGHIVVRDDLTWKRPASGVSPKYIDDVIGKKLEKDIKADDIVQWEHLDV